jgi:hypothetical protein
MSSLLAICAEARTTAACSFPPPSHVERGGVILGANIRAALAYRAVLLRGVVRVALKCARPSSTARYLEI